MSEPDESSPPDSFPEILATGSMLNLAARLVENVPARFGAYRVIERIGEGGMGVVYLAQQDPPLVRRVAIKLARNAVPDDRALARFESERQALAAYYATAQAQALQGRDEEALRTLARASELGFDDADQLEHDLAFEKLRARAEFRTVARAARQRAL